MAVASGPAGFKIFPAGVEGLDPLPGGFERRARVVELVAVGEDGWVVQRLLGGVEGGFGVGDFVFHLLELALFHVGEAFLWRGEG